MNLILPNYMLQARRFKCPTCGFAFIKKTPSKVEKCPKCEERGFVIAVIERGVKEKELDSYSKHKLRMYADIKGRSHIEDIKMREIVSINGKDTVVYKDNKGRIIDTIPDVPVPKEIKLPKFIKE